VDTCLRSNEFPLRGSREIYDAWEMLQNLALRRRAKLTLVARSKLTKTINIFYRRHYMFVRKIQYFHEVLAKCSD